jgi:uncharacterized protein (DUF4415 family)
MKKTVRYEVDLAQLPPLTEEQRAELRALAAQPESSIDYSDLPPLDGAFLRNAVRNPLYRPKKTSTTVQLDADVLVWLKS